MFGSSSRSVNRTAASNRIARLLRGTRRRRTPPRPRLVARWWTANAAISVVLPDRAGSARRARVRVRRRRSRSLLERLEVEPDQVAEGSERKSASRAAQSSPAHRGQRSLRRRWPTARDTFSVLRRRDREREPVQLAAEPLRLVGGEAADDDEVVALVARWRSRRAASAWRAHRPTPRRRAPRGRRRRPRCFSSRRLAGRQELVDLVECLHRPEPGVGDLRVPAALLFDERVVAGGGPLARARPPATPGFSVACPSRGRDPDRCCLPLDPEHGVALEADEAGVRRPGVLLEGRQADRADIQLPDTRSSESLSGSSRGRDGHASRCRGRDCPTSSVHERSTSPLETDVSEASRVGLPYKWPGTA